MLLIRVTVMRIKIEASAVNELNEKVEKRRKGN